MACEDVAPSGEGKWWWWWCFFLGGGGEGLVMWRVKWWLCEQERFSRFPLRTERGKFLTRVCTKRVWKEEEEGGGWGGEGGGRGREERNKSKKRGNEKE